MCLLWLENKIGKKEREKKTEGNRGVLLPLNAKANGTASIDTQINGKKAPLKKGRW